MTPNVEGMLPPVVPSPETNGTWIDHILHFARHRNIHCMGVFAATGSAWEDVSDHQVLWCQYALPSCHVPHETPSVRTAVREYVELPLTDKKLAAEYADEMNRWLLSSPRWVDGCEAGSFLHSLSVFSTDLTRKIVKGANKLRSPYKDGWSPTYVSYKANLHALLEIRRHLLGQHGVRKWKTPRDVSCGITELANSWERFVLAFKFSCPERDGILAVTNHPPEFWRTVLASDPRILHFLEDDMEILRSRMHGRQRTDLRKQINRAVAVREASREAGKIGRVIKSVLGNQTPPYSMTYIRAPDGRVLSDEEEIHNMVTAHFNE